MDNEIKTIETQLNAIMEEILLNMDNYSKDWKDDPQYKKITQLKTEKKFLLERVSEKEHILQKNKTVIAAVEDYLHHQSEINPFLLYTMFIHKLYVYQNEIDIEVTMFDYLTDLQTDFIYKGDEIA